MKNMIHTYKISGMTCSGCEANVRSALLTINNVTDVEVSRQDDTVTITMDKHVGLAVLQKALSSKYELSVMHHNENAEMARSWLKTYKPILVIFTFIIITTTAIQANHGAFHLMDWMQHFMAGFFLVFSFFKMLDLAGFAESYRMYDVVAKRIPAWAYVYAFLELALGIAFLTGFNPLITNITTAVVMSVSIIGVLQTVLNKRKIQCACLGAVFNLPMSTVTIIEDGLMIAMSVTMILAII